MATIADYDKWFKPCKVCGYDAGKAAKKSAGICWKCGNSLRRDFSDRALKIKSKKIFIDDLIEETADQIGGFKVKYVAIIKDCEQCAPDDWRDAPKVIELSQSTTVEDLIKWQKTIYPKNKNVLKGDIIPMTITIMD